MIHTAVGEPDTQTQKKQVTSLKFKISLSSIF
jgi:hypothetical protein